MPDQIRQPGASDETARQQTQFSPNPIDPQNHAIQGQNKDEVAHGSMEPEDSRTVTGVLGGGSGNAGGVGSPGGSDQQEGGQRWGGDAQAQQQQFGGQGSGPGEAGSIGGARPFSAEEASEQVQAQAESESEQAGRAPEWEGQQQAQSDSSSGQMGGSSGAGAFEQIREHMEVVGADDVHLGTVDKVEGDRIKLTKADSGMGSHQGHHHYISRGLVAGVEGDRVRLSATAANAYAMEQEE